MTRKYIFEILVLAFILLVSCKKQVVTPSDNDFIQLISLHVGAVKLEINTDNTDVQVDQPIVARFSDMINTQDIAQNFLLLNKDQKSLPLEFSFLDNDKTISAKPFEELLPSQTYTVRLGNGIENLSGVKFPGEDFQFTTQIPPLVLEKILINGTNMDTTGKVIDIAPVISFSVSFSHDVELTELQNYFSVTGGGKKLSLNFTAESSRKFTITPAETPDHLMLHVLKIDNQLKSKEENPFEGFTKRFYTRLDTTPKFPVISDQDLLTLVQQETFKYFWDFGHPVSGLSRERNTSGDLVTSGGSGFGVMAILIGIERGFITRSEGIDRLEKIVDFLAQADRFHGVWSHWLNGNTGQAIPFSPNDDGGDLVETSYLIMGLLAARQYLNDQQTLEAGIQTKIDSLWYSVEWDWYTQGGQNGLFWHWSPNYQWEKNHKIQGYNEALITYMLAAASPTHPIEANVYHEGWARNGGMVNGNTYYGYNLPLGPNLGGPLFFEQYTFLGIDPRGLNDTYANYWDQVRHHSWINYEYCKANPGKYVGYNDQCWGLTASDGNQGYSAHSPTNDRGVITPTAALSSMPFTPIESQKALKHFYYHLGDRLWGNYGFYDAFNITEGWTAGSYLAIDQGPIIIMIENYRTGLIWNLFMSCPEVEAGLTKLGFTY